MAFVSEVLASALRRLQVIDRNGSVPARDAQFAIEALNDMVTRWEGSGLALGWKNVSTVDETIPVPDEALSAVKWNLAVELAAEYPLPAAMPGIADKAKHLLNELRRDRLTEMPLVQCNDLPAPSAGGRFNILTDGQ